MSNADLASRLQHAAAAEPAMRLGLSAVVADGRRRRRRRHATQIAGGAAVLTVALVGAAVVPELLEVSQPSSPAAMSPTTLALGGATATPAPLTTDPLKGTDLSRASAAQRSEVSDRYITDTEYNTAFRRFAACMKKAGFQIYADTFPDFTGSNLIPYTVPDAAVQSGVDEQCYQQEFEYVDLVRQAMYRDYSDTTRMLSECLRSRGISPAKSADEIDQQLKAAGLQGAGCAPHR